MGRLGRLFQIFHWSILAFAGGLLIVRPDHAPKAVFLTLLSSLWPIASAWKAARGTALRASIAWAFAAIACGLISQAVAWEAPLSEGRPWAGHWTYLCTLAVFASSISVLNARRPGGGAWAILMGLLVLVLLIPWLEGSGLARNADPLRRLRLEAPWTLFYGLVVIAGVTNYLPTRYGPGAGIVGVAFVLEYLALTNAQWPPARRAAIWSAVPGLFALSVAVAEICVRRSAACSSGTDRLWLWFRDHWGVVWALRVRDRFNESARALNWPVRLAWGGLTQPGDSDSSRDQNSAESTLKSLLRRFADRERLDLEAGPSCDSERADGS